MLKYVIGGVLAGGYLLIGNQLLKNARNDPNYTATFDRMGSWARCVPVLFWPAYFIAKNKISGGERLPPLSAQQPTSGTRVSGETFMGPQIAAKLKVGFG
jgi:hypothetical protein